MSTSRKSASDKILQHLKDCPIISGSISIGKRHVSCKGCRVTKTFDSQDRNFVRSLVRHSELDCHKLYCHWTLKRNLKSTNGFQTIRIGQSLVNDQITNFYQSSKNPGVTGDDNEAEEQALSQPGPSVKLCNNKNVVVSEQTVREKSKKATSTGCAVSHSNRRHITGSGVKRAGYSSNNSTWIYRWDVRGDYQTIWS